ncbi:MAG: alanine:cation symporter family protein [Alphaproteobacteria bacterium]|nr:alanine:cation symporter family protein [Alphaproteobacteria bacterium]
MLDKCFSQEVTEGGSCAAAGFDAAVDCSFSAVTCATNEIIFYSLPISIGEPAVSHSLPLILLWIGACSIFFTLYLGFVNFRYFGHAIRVLCGAYKEPGAKGQLSNFESFTASMSATIGLGNIAGVAVAVSIGGPGAVLWMILMGFLGMSTKFAEVMLGVKYRITPQAGSPHEFAGGPMYYVRHAFERYGIPFLGPIFAAMFAVCCILGSLGGGNMFQANQTFEQILHVTGGEQSVLYGKGWLFGLGLAALVGVVIVGGIGVIGRVSARLVPAMAVIYLSACLFVIALYWQDVPGAVVTIFREALSPEAGMGGLIGAILMGVKRASFSNEAGLGSAAIVQATAKTAFPVRQGMVGMLGPFLDTVVVCSATALLIVVTGAYESGQGVSGVQLTSNALEHGGAWLSYVLALAVFLFAYSTLITWFYYGEIGATSLLGEKKWVSVAFKIIFLTCVVLGCAMKLENIVNLTDALFLSMAFPNIIALYLFAPEIKRDLKVYIKNLKA